MSRPQYFVCENGKKAPLPFSDAEYERRLTKLRAIMAARGMEAAVFTSMHNIAYYSGFLYCSFGRPYGLVVTADRCTTVSANIDAGQPWRRCYGDNVIYTDWERNNYWRAVKNLVGNAKAIGIEGDHMTLAQRGLAEEFLDGSTFTDIAPDTMQARMIKSAEEIVLIREGARVADVGGAAIHEAIKVGAREIDIAMAGRDAMELEISHAHPNSEIRDSWVWFQSGINTDGAHNPVTTRRLEDGDILSLNTFPMISGYYTALERTLFVGEPDAESLRIWKANVAAHELGLSLIKPGATCSGITAEINKFFESEGLLQYRSFGYGHSFGVLSHYYGREAGLELREDIDTVLEPGMVVSMEPMLFLPEGTPGAGGYREHDILVVGEDSAENITGFPYGPEHNIILR
ncbi:aminopeptidase P family protein [Aliiroseovarius sp. F20344]|uniref:aminopeptidase P family protein n=1 Tax=Aliiroseovarius sp. F20344 TaxID=2926414 RepID=UPI001FF2E184|nr:aminopeptidase P family protein [Aliiroseovarius sp. F20344]MCK0143116.1 aminopeptidase P family protein [Aliiroseovarius sp. F20344]